MAQRIDENMLVRRAVLDFNWTGGYTKPGALSPYDTLTVGESRREFSTDWRTRSLPPAQMSAPYRPRPRIESQVGPRELNASRMIPVSSACPLSWAKPLASLIHCYTFRRI